ncbi:MAG: HisA/HisF-related TIM barrel protein [Magnetovibrio sp.]|nr:HisA/HisF-related TIM barrel protein [Magnetovibrio sp.]
MVKKRIIATILVRNGIAVQSYGFSRYLPIGCPVITAEYLDRWGADEIVLLDIGASRNEQSIDPALVQKVARAARIPLAVGGGIKNMEQIAELMANGADKIVLNTVFLENPQFISEAAHIYGRQCIIVSIDAVKDKTAGIWASYSNARPDLAGEDVFALTARAEEMGAGEILLASVDQDGTCAGYDLDLVHKAHEQLDVPLISLGGAGAPNDFAEVLKGPCAAAAAGNYFQHFEHSIALVKHALHDLDYAVRKHRVLHYDAIEQTNNGRVLSNQMHLPSAIKEAS